MMNIQQIAKIAVLLSLTIFTSGCLEKADNLSSDAKTESEWQWDDTQKNWLHNGTPYTAKADNLSASTWKKQDNAIVLQVESPKSLTAFDNAPKALQMKVFQLSDSKAFLQASTASSGLRHLLEKEQTDPAIVGMDRLFVLPGVSQTITLERKEKARYIGIVLGYSSLKQEKISRLIPIVTLDEESDESQPEAAAPLPATAQATGQTAVKPKSSARPVILKMKLVLEADGINKLEIEAK